jgi:hypothetical protein
LDKVQIVLNLDLFDKVAKENWEKRKEIYSREMKTNKAIPQESEKSNNEKQIGK